MSPGGWEEVVLGPLAPHLVVGQVVPHQQKAVFLLCDRVLSANFFINVAANLFKRKGVTIVNAQLTAHVAQALGNGGIARGIDPPHHVVGRAGVVVADTKMVVRILQRQGSFTTATGANEAHLEVAAPGKVLGLVHAKARPQAVQEHGA